MLAVIKTSKFGKFSMARVNLSAAILLLTLIQPLQCHAAGAECTRYCQYSGQPGALRSNGRGAGEHTSGADRTSKSGLTGTTRSVASLKCLRPRSKGLMV